MRPISPLRQTHHPVRSRRMRTLLETVKLNGGHDGSVHRLNGAS